MTFMRFMDGMAYGLLVVGALNWGLVGVMGIDVVATIFGGSAAAASRIIYLLVGLAALYEIAGWRSIKQRWCSTVA
jgi:uncharacterized membrane protein YuzA (DUF378 family)